RLVAEGKQVISPTGHPEGKQAEGITAVPFNFDKPDEIAKSLEGVSVLYNTYWIRFAHRDMTFDKAIANSKTLIRAAKDAGVRRIVHISIANPSADSPLPYYRGKAIVEEAIRESGMTYGILRPAVIFGDKGILINNIAWFLRHMPVFIAPGNGEYCLQPIFVEDLADLAVTRGSNDEKVILDAVGPEKFAFNDLLDLIKGTVGSRTLIMHLNPKLAYPMSRLLGYALKDVVLTWDEVEGLLANLLVSDQPPTGHTLLSQWLEENVDWIGTKYMSELGKHYRA
ncbi:MAG TPA: NAD(P)H-binding protein, partial [Armatimonadota bacterium]|nr:NAD(P)H-binding protein [Armatimonadota bacterium]